MRYLLQMTMATDEVTERPSAPATPIREPAPSDISFPSPPTVAAGGFPAGAEADMSERASERSPRAIPRYAVNLDASSRQVTRAHVPRPIGSVGRGALTLPRRTPASSGINAVTRRVSVSCQCGSKKKRQGAPLGACANGIEVSRLFISFSVFFTAGEMVRASLQESIVDLAVLSARDV